MCIDLNMLHKSIPGSYLHGEFTCFRRRAGKLRIEEASE